MSHVNEKFLDLFIVFEMVKICEGNSGAAV